MPLLAPLILHSDDHVRRLRMILLRLLRALRRIALRGRIVSTAFGFRSVPRAHNCAHLRSGLFGCIGLDVETLFIDCVFLLARSIAVRGDT